MTRSGLCKSNASRWLGVSMMVFLASGTIARAEPRTLYKPQHIENARRNLERYAWAERIVKGWKSSAAPAMQQEREFFEELIPELTPGSPYTNGCPACILRAEHHAGSDPGQD